MNFASIPAVSFLTSCNYAYQSHFTVTHPKLNPEADPELNPNFDPNLNPSFDLILTLNSCKTRLGVRAGGEKRSRVPCSAGGRAQAYCPAAVCAASTGTEGAGRACAPASAKGTSDPGAQHCASWSVLGPLQ